MAAFQQAAIGAFLETIICKNEILSWKQYYQEYSNAIYDHKWAAREKKSLPLPSGETVLESLLKNNRLRNLFSLNCKQKQAKIHYHDMEGVCLHGL